MNKHIEEITRLIDQQEEVVPFLKDLTVAEKKKLLPVLTELRLKYNTRQEEKNLPKKNVGYNHPSRFIYPERQRDLVVLAAVMCADTVTQFRNTINWNELFIVLGDDMIEKVLPYHVPKWLNRSLNRLETGDHWLYYQKVMMLLNKGYAKPTDELIARILVGSLVQLDSEVRNPRYCLNVLEGFPEFLEKHIWLLFEIPTSIHGHYYARVDDPRFYETNPWIIAFKDLIEQKKISRLQVLSKCLLACTKGFNKALVGWYYKLFNLLEPTKEELLSLQTELFTCINSDTSQAIKTGLAIVKELMAEPTFNLNGFLDVAPQLLTSTIKSTLSTTLTLLDKIAKKQEDQKDQKDQKEKIAAIAVGVLASEYENIQVKAAKLIKKYAGESEEVKTSLQDYYSYLFNDAKAILADLLPTDFEETVEAEPLMESERFEILVEDQKIESYETYDELVFFISQVLDNNEPQHVDQLMVNLPKLDQLVTAENVDKMASVFKRALDRIWMHEESTTSHFIFTASYCLNDYADFLSKKFPNNLQKRAKYIAEKTKDGGYFRDRLKSLSKKKNKIRAYALIDELFIFSQSLLHKSNELRMLSSLTHYPCWVDPEILIDRLLKFEEYQVKINILDWQVAAFRLPVGQAIGVHTLSKINRIRQPEVKDALLYYYGQGDLVVADPVKINYCLPFILAKRDQKILNSLKEKYGEELTHIIQDYTWLHEDIEYETKSYDYKTSEFHDVIKTKNVLSIAELNYRRPKPSGLFQTVKNYFGKMEDESKIGGIFFYYDFVNRARSYHWLSLLAVDTKRFLMLTPNHFTLYLSQVIKSRLERSDVTGEDEKRQMIACLELLNEGWHRKDESEISYLFLGAAMLCSGKIARQFVAELWINKIQFDLIDSERLGTIVGKLLSSNYGPLKRLTDLLSANMYNISATHDEALLHFVAKIIQHLADTPIKNTKKLLEIYVELMIKRNNTTSLEWTQAKLELWENTASLKKVIKKIVGVKVK